MVLYAVRTTSAPAEGADAYVNMEEVRAFRRSRSHTIIFDMGGSQIESTLPWDRLLSAKFSTDPSGADGKWRGVRTRSMMAGSGSDSLCASSVNRSRSWVSSLSRLAFAIRSVRACRSSSSCSRSVISKRDSTTHRADTASCGGCRGEPRSRFLIQTETYRSSLRGLGPPSRRGR